MDTTLQWDSTFPLLLLSLPLGESETNNSLFGRRLEALLSAMDWSVFLSETHDSCIESNCYSSVVTMFGFSYSSMYRGFVYVCVCVGGCGLVY